LASQAALEGQSHHGVKQSLILESRALYGLHHDVQAYLGIGLGRGPGNSGLDSRPGLLQANLDEKLFL
jgi:hypothetical protein